MTRKFPFRMIAVDVGNSALKIGVLNAQGQLGAAPGEVFDHVAAISKTDVSDLQFACQLASVVDLSSDLRLRWCVVSVNDSVESQLAQWVQRHRPDDEYAKLQHIDMPIRTNVPSPEDVGMDRLAAALAVNQSRPGDRSAIVIDAGTAITVDLVSADGIFQGGAILPGFRTSAQALALAAEALPRIEPIGLSQTVPPIGKSTLQAIQSGLTWGCIGAVKELVRRIGSQLSDGPLVYCTGGVGDEIGQLLGQKVQLDEHLVLRGALLGGAQLRK